MKQSSELLHTNTTGNQAELKAMSQPEGEVEVAPSIHNDDYADLAAFRKALRKFLRFAEDSARQSGLTPQQHQLLLAVRADRTREWATVTEIADCLQVQHHTVVGLLDRCRAAGLVDRSKDPHDGRVVRVSLTPAGATVLEEITARNLRELRALGRLTAELELLATTE